MRLPAKCCRFLSPQPILLLQIGKERNIYLFVNVSAKKNRKKIGSVVPLMIRFNVGLFFIYELNTLYFYFRAQGGGGGGSDFRWRDCQELLRNFVHDLLHARSKLKGTYVQHTKTTGNMLIVHDTERIASQNF